MDTQSIETKPETDTFFRTEHHLLIGGMERGDEEKRERKGGRESVDKFQFTLNVKAQNM